MNRVMPGVDAAFTYLDDILIGSPTLQQHLLDDSDLFRHLAAVGLVINAEKCLFNVPSIKFLGHQVAAGGITPLPHQVVALQQHPRPGNIKELQGFLGMVNFYRRFVAGAARILKPLMDALRGGPPPSLAVDWSNSMDQAFQAAKAALAEPRSWRTPVPSHSSPWLLTPQRITWALFSNSVLYLPQLGAHSASSLRSWIRHS